MLKSLFVILLFFNALGAFSLHSQSINDSKQMEKPPLDVEDRQQKLLQAPGWAESSSPGDTSELMTAVNSVAVLEFAQVKRIVQQLDELTESDDLSLAERLALDSKLFILNRAYFAVPEWEKKPRFKAFGGWMGIPEREEEVNLLFPLKLDSSGRLYISASHGGYMGHNFKAFDEFLYFSERYVPRYTSRSERCPQIEN